MLFDFASASDNIQPVLMEVKLTAVQVDGSVGLEQDSQGTFYRKVLMQLDVLSHTQINPVFQDLCLRATNLNHTAKCNTA